MVPVRYREVLRTPSVGWLLSTSLVGRLPQGMIGLALLLLVTQHSSYAAAGAVSAAYLVATCLATPFVARLADRLGRRRVLTVTATGSAIGLSGLALAPPHLGLLLAVAAFAGVFTPPISASARAVWPALLPVEQRQAMFGLEATLQELTFIVGPALVGLLAALGGAKLAIIGSGLLALAGTLAYVSDPAADRGLRGHDEPRAAGAMRSAALLRLVAAGVAIVAALSVAELGIVAFVSGRQADAAAGLALAIWSVGSLVGGIVFGAMAAADTRLAAFLGPMAISLAVLAAAPGTIGLELLLLASGSLVAPALASVYSRVGALAPAGAATEVFGWMASGLMAGAAAGAALGGLIVAAYGPRPAFVVAALFAVAATVVAEPLRRPLDPPPPPPPPPPSPNRDDHGVVAVETGG